MYAAVHMFTGQVTFNKVQGAQLNMTVFFGSFEYLDDKHLTAAVLFSLKVD